MINCLKMFGEKLVNKLERSVSEFRLRLFQLKVTKSLKSPSELKLPWGLIFLKRGIKSCNLVLRERECPSALLETDPTKQLPVMSSVFFITE